MARIKRGDGRYAVTLTGAGEPAGQLPLCAERGQTSVDTVNQALLESDDFIATMSVETADLAA